MAGIKRSQLVAMNQHYRRFSIDYFLDCQERVGFQNIELWCGASHFFIDAKSHESTANIKRKLREHNLRVVSVTTPSMAYQYQYASQEPEILNKSFSYFKNGIEVASELGADRVVINSGWGYWNEDPEEMWKRCREHLWRVCEEASKYGIICVMESLRKDETNLIYDIHTAKRMYDELQHPALKMMVDTIATGAVGESLALWLETFGDNLVHMHFLDGNPYVHNIWGDGNTPLASQIETLNQYHFRGYLVQEVADEKYFSDPFAADLKNMRMLERFIEE